ncbi:hypothetical protein JR316_0002809 [Psilocybe cubensis]|uniref:Uncharacterized protein n=1 Tax=Psilocybe cubensis TaxID=181762 RepID=A0ACB8HE34_PSICU|nr:hypothetical protein JR316_0002809 [Psilocybe cubensis]KAH9485892.1 hypothetical protein JR316_0002809 [Psilocybe cubensis]
MTEYDFSPEAEAAYHAKLKHVGEWASVHAVPTIHSRARSHSQAYAHSQHAASSGGYSIGYAGSQDSLAHYALLTPPSRGARSHSRSNSYASSNTSRPSHSHETRMTSPPPPSQLSELYLGAHHVHGVQKTASMHSVHAMSRSGSTTPGVQQHAPTSHSATSHHTDHRGGHARSRSMSMSMPVSSHPYTHGYPHANVYPIGYQSPSRKGYAHPQPYPTPYSPPGGTMGLVYSPGGILPQTVFENRTASANRDGIGRESQSEMGSLNSQFKGKKKSPKVKSTPLFEIVYAWRMAYTWNYVTHTQTLRHLLIRRLHTRRRTSCYMVLVPSRCARAIPWSDDENEYVLVKPGESVTLLDPPHPGLIRELTEEEWDKLVRREDVKEHRPVVFESQPGRKLSVRGENITSLSPYSLTSSSGKRVGRGVRLGDNFFHLVHPGDSVTVVGFVEGIVGRDPVISFSKATWGYLEGQGKLEQNGKDEYAPLDLRGRTEFDSY